MRTAFVSASIVLISVVLSQAAVKPLAEVPTRLWFGNASTDGITSDGSSVTVNGVVSDYSDGLENVLSVIQSTGNFRFSTSANTRQPAIRALCLNFGTQFEARGSAVPFTNGLALQCGNVLEAMHSYQIGDQAIQNLRYGQSVAKLVRFTFTDGGYYYRVGYGSDMDQDGLLDSPPVNVTCIAPEDTALPCVRWVLAPQGAEGTAALYRFQIVKNGEGPAEPLGSFLLPFSETFSRK